MITLWSTWYLLTLSHILFFNCSLFYFRHESANGFYRVSAYFLAKVFCDVLPMRALPVLGFSLISYWMIGMYKTSHHWLGHLEKGETHTHTDTYTHKYIFLSFTTAPQLNLSAEEGVKCLPNYGLFS